MMNDLEQLEQLIREQPLREPSAALDERVLREVGGRWTDGAAWRIGAVGLALAAAVTLVGAVGWGEGEVDETASTQALVVTRGDVEDGVKVWEVAGAWEGAVGEGVVRMEEVGPAVAVRAARVRYVQETGEDGAQVQWVIPEEQYVYVPLGYQ